MEASPAARYPPPLGRARVDWDLHYTLTDATFRTQKIKLREMGDYAKVKEGCAKSAAVSEGGARLSECPRPPRQQTSSLS